MNSLAAADSVIIPVQCEYYALEGLGQLVNAIKLVQKNLNPDLTIEGVLLTMYDGRLNLSMQVAEETRKHLRQSCLQGGDPEERQAERGAQLRQAHSALRRDVLGCEELYGTCKGGDDA